MKKGTHTGPMETLDAFHQKMKITKLVNEVHQPLPTTFKETLGVSLPAAVVELARTLRTKYNYVISEELRPVIENKLIKLAREVNRKLKEAEENSKKPTK